MYDNTIEEIPPPVRPQQQLEHDEHEKHEKHEKHEQDWAYGLNIPTLTYLDLSFNQIVHIENLRLIVIHFTCWIIFFCSECVPNLQELYFVQNKIRVMKGLSHLTQLRVLELGANRIREIQGLDVCVTFLHFFFLMKSFKGTCQFEEFMAR